MKLYIRLYIVILMVKVVHILQNLYPKRIVNMYNGEIRYNENKENSDTF